METIVNDFSFDMIKCSGNYIALIISVSSKNSNATNCRSGILNAPSVLSEYPCI